METEPEDVPVESSSERLLNTIEGEQILGVGKTKKKTLEVRNKNFMEKPLHAQFRRKT